LRTRLSYLLSLPLLAGLAIVAAGLASPADSDVKDVLKRFPMDKDSMHQWSLPKKLNEISGLALTRDGRLLTVDDENAIIYELDFEGGHIVKAFALGSPTIRADFEGIAATDDRVWLTDSDGTVYAFTEGADGERVTYERFDTQLGDLCEIEGLAASPDQRLLYFLCKQVRDKSVVDGLMVFAWSIRERRLLPDASLALPQRRFARAINSRKLHPSAIAIDPATGDFVMIAARQKALFVMQHDGRFVGARKLPTADFHLQPEGIEITSDGRLLIADEGGKHRARLAIYRQEGATGDHDDE
jgi:uncharacterized protein YjiK